MSDFTFECSSCKILIEADEAMRGGEVDCPACGAHLVAPELNLASGMELDGFKLVRRLGAGGMGEVWLANQESLGRHVAFKILSTKLSRDKEFADRFMQEVKILGMLSHQNIITAYQAGVCKGIRYVAMEYVDGVELGSRLRIDRTIPEREALLLVRKLAEALSYAWTKFKVLHRDIKPENIMISSESGEPELMDLGISKSMEESSSLTMTGVVMGTPYYMSPEQARADKELDCRADIYSLGATLYHMLSGRVPYEGPTALSIIAMHLSPEPAPSLRDNKNLSPQCIELVETMMAKDRERRQPDWDAVIRDIDSVLSGKHPAAVAAALQNSEETRRRRLKLVTILSGVVVLVAAIAGVSFLIAGHSGLKTEVPAKAVPSAAKPQTPPVQLQPSPVKEETVAEESAKEKKEEPKTEAAPVAAPSAPVVAETPKPVVAEAPKPAAEEPPKPVVFEPASPKTEAFTVTQKRKEEEAKTVSLPAAKEAETSEASSSEQSVLSNLLPMALSTLGGDSGKASSGGSISMKGGPVDLLKFMNDIGEHICKGHVGESMALLREALYCSQHSPEVVELIKTMKRGCKSLENADSQLLESFNQEAAKDNVRNVQFGDRAVRCRILPSREGCVRLLEIESGREYTLEPSALGPKERARFADSDETRNVIIGVEALKHGNIPAAQNFFAGTGALKLPLMTYLLKSAMTALPPGSMGKPPKGQFLRQERARRLLEQQNESRPEERRPPKANPSKIPLGGEVANFNEETLEIEIRYDFKESSELSDWTKCYGVGISSLSEGAMSLSSENMILFASKVRFDSFSMTVRSTFTGGCIEGAETGGGEGALFMLSGFGNQRDGAAKGKFSSGMFAPLGPSEFKYGSSVESTVAWSDGVCSFNAGRRKWPSYQMSGRNGAGAVLGIQKGSLSCSEITLKGRINRAWYDANKK